MLSEDCINQVKTLFPWQYESSWYQALASFVGLQQHEFCYIEHKDHYWKLAVYPLQGDKVLAALTNYYSSAIGPSAPKNTTQWSDFFKKITDEIPRCHKIQLSPLNSFEASALQHVNTYRWGIIVKQSDTNWVADTTDYWLNRSRQLRSTIRRKHRKLTEISGHIEIHTAINPELQQHYWQIYQRSWKPNEPSESFINTLFTQASADKTLRLGIVMIDGKPAAMQCWLVAQGVAAIYKLAQDPAYDSYSPGTVLTAALVDYVIEKDQVTTIDFLTGNDPYKAMWMDEARPLYKADAYKLSNPVALCDYITQALKQLIHRCMTKLQAKLREAPTP